MPETVIYAIHTERFKGSASYEPDISTIHDVQSVESHKFSVLNMYFSKPFFFCKC